MTLLVALAGCTGEPAPTDPNTDGVSGTTGETGRGSSGDTGSVDACALPAVEVGGGEHEHAPLAEGDALLLVHGPQGGWHVNVSGRVTGIGMVASIAPVLTRASDGLVLAGDQQPTALALVDAAPCGLAFWGVRAFVDDVPSTDPQGFTCSLDGAPAVLDVTATDLATGEVAVGSVDIVLAADPDDPCP